MQLSAMTPRERRAALSLSAIFALRMLGLFMILPVFALYAEELAGVTPFLVGLAIGIYGLTQAGLQIPFGMLSDRVGRKPVIVGGLLIFAIGSVVAATADTITGVIAGRALQGAGAVAAAVMALAADLTREEHRTKAMAIIGMSIGLAFVAAMVLGPILNQLVGVPGIFWLTALLALGGIGIVLFVVPRPERSRFHGDAGTAPAQFARVLRDGELLRLNVGILVLHMVLTASFVVIPLELRAAGLAPADHWLVYLPVMVLAIAAMVPFIIVAESRQKMKPVFLGAVAALGLAQLGSAWSGGSLTVLIACIWLFFTAFNVLEATLPSLVSKLAPVEAKGTAMGVYSSSQFAGAFIGGAAGGWLHGAHGNTAVLLFGATAVGLWWLYAASMRKPRYLTTRLVHVGPVDAVAAGRLHAELAGVPGVAEVVISVEEGVAYLRVDGKRLDSAALERFSAA